MTPITPVDDDEDLYRRIPHDDGTLGLYQTDAHGTVRFLSQAFADRLRRPSVDRANLLGHDPTRAQKSPYAGVTMVVAGKVRALGPMEQYDAEHRLKGHLTID